MEKNINECIPGLWREATATDLRDPVSTKQNRSQQMNSRTDIYQNGKLKRKRQTTKRSKIKEILE